jgi:hypothetical protein
MAMQFDDRDKRALHALDNDFSISADGETASIAGEMEIKIARHAHDSGDQFWLTIRLPDGEEINLRIRRTQLLECDASIRPQA